MILGVTAIESEWLVSYAPRSCRLSEPLEDPAPRYSQENKQMYCHVTATYGKLNYIPYIFNQCA